MNRFNTSMMVPIALLLSVPLTGGKAFGQSATTIDQLYQAAKQEGALTLYGGGAAAPHERRAVEFEKRFPGIKVSVTADFSNILAPKIDEQIHQGKLAVDLTIFQTLQDYVRWKKTGVLLPFKPEGFDQIDPSFKDADARLIVCSVGRAGWLTGERCVLPNPFLALDPADVRLRRDALLSRRQMVFAANSLILLTPILCYP